MSKHVYQREQKPNHFITIHSQSLLPMHGAHCMNLKHFVEYLGWNPDLGRIATTFLFPTYSPISTFAIRNILCRLQDSIQDMT